MSIFDDLPKPYEDDFNGNPVLVLATGKDKKTDKIYSMSFGKQKAKAILYNLERIKEFANQTDEPF